MPNGTNKIQLHTNFILDTGSETMLIRQDKADKSKLLGTNRTLNITNAVATKKKVPSKLVSF